jgi:phosphate/sulfate permease
VLLVVGLAYTAISLTHDVSEVGTPTTTSVPFFLLGVALLIALGFEFVNGFHDTANAVATVIYTHSMSPNFAVVWSGGFNFLGVLVSSRSSWRWHSYGTLAKVPSAIAKNVHNDMYLTSETLRWLDKSTLKYDGDAKLNVGEFKKEIDNSTKFIPLWVKVAVGIALGLGTMVGWKRIVRTVGEKIGKTHLTYAQGASAELVAMATIQAADMYGLPVSTTHVLSSGVAGTMPRIARGSR